MRKIKQHLIDRGVSKKFESTLLNHGYIIIATRKSILNSSYENSMPSRGPYPTLVSSIRTKSIAVRLHRGSAVTLSRTISI